MLKAILFDLDGTIINSIPLHDKSLRQIFARLGVKMPKKKIHAMLRLPTEEIYFRLEVKKKTGLNFQPFNSFKRNVYYEMIKGRDITLPGVESALRMLGKKYRLAIVTNSSRKTVHKSTPPRILNLFGAIVTYDDVRHGKPCPEPIRKALGRLGVKPKEAVFVGDSYYDAIACNELNMRFFGVLTGVSTAKELRDNGAWAVMKSARDLQKFLQKIPAQ